RLRWPAPRIPLSARARSTTCGRRSDDRTQHHARPAASTFHLRGGEAWAVGPESHTRGSPNPGIFWNQSRFLGKARRRPDRKILLVKHSRREASTIQSDNLQEMSGGHRDQRAPAFRDASARDDAKGLYSFP